MSIFCKIKNDVLELAFPFPLLLIVPWLVSQMQGNKEGASQ
jgi:hypothetical protein